MVNFNSDIPFNYDVEFNSAAELTFTFVGPPLTRLEINTFAPTLVSKIEVPLKSLFVTTFPTVQNTGVGIVVPLKDLVVKTGAGYFILETIKYTGEPIPIEHFEDALKLEADSKTSLYEVILPNGQGIIPLKNNKTVTWQGKVYQGTGIKMDGVANYADAETSRPKFSIFNPDGVFSSLVNKGLLENSTIVRYRVLGVHITEDKPIYQKQQWKVKRVASVVSNVISLELRDMLDGQNFLTPGRVYIPPNFPTVSLN